MLGDHAPVDQLCDEDQHDEDVLEQPQAAVEDMDYDENHIDADGLEWFEDTESECYCIWFQLNVYCIHF